MKKAEANDPRVATMVRTFNAPRQLVWDAWTQAEHLVNWWGPKGMNTKVEELNFEEGGSWKYTMMMPDGNEFVTEGTFIEIKEPEKLVTSADFKPMTVDVVLTVLFEDLGEQTKMTFSVSHKTEEYRQQQEEMGFRNGWGSTFDRLEVYLKEN